MVKDCFCCLSSIFLIYLRPTSSSSSPHSFSRLLSYNCLLILSACAQCVEESQLACCRKQYQYNHRQCVRPRPRPQQIILLLPTAMRRWGAFNYTPPGMPTPQIRPVWFCFRPLRQSFTRDGYHDCFVNLEWSIVWPHKLRLRLCPSLMTATRTVLNDRVLTSTG